MNPSLAPLCAIILALNTLPTTAATVDTGSLATTFAITGFPPRISSIEVSQSVTVNLNSLAGLTLGSNISITFSSPDELIWLGGFGADTGDLTLLCHARLTLAAGIYSVSSDETWSFGPVAWDASYNPGDPVNSDPVGYISGPVPQPLTLTVPWGTDLSAVTLTLTDLFSVEGVDPYITQSGVSLNQATLSTASVPEPSVSVLTILSSAALLTHRRRA